MDPLEGAKRAMAKNLRAVPGGIGGDDLSNCGRKLWDLRIFPNDFHLGSNVFPYP